MVEMVREKSGNLKKKEERQGILTGFSVLKVLPHLRFDLMMSVSAECFINKSWKIF